MDIVQHQHGEVQSYIEQVNDKTMIAIQMEEQRLNQRYFHLLNQLEKTKLQIIKLEEKLRQQNEQQLLYIRLFSLENHPQIKQIISELSKIDQYRLSLINKTQQLTQELQLNQFSIKELKEQVINKRLQIRDWVRDCWSIQQQINNTTSNYTQSTSRTQRIHLQSLDITSNRSNVNLFITNQESNTNRLSLSQLPPITLKKHSKSKLLDVLQKASVRGQQQPVNDIIEIYKQIHILRKQIIEWKQNIIKKQNQYSSIRNSFVYCANLSLKLLKSKQKVTNRNGYANSIYFDINTSMNQSNTEVSSNHNRGRQIQNILYDTLKQIMVNMIDTQQNDQQNSNEKSIIKNAISLEQFLQFSSEQILGILALQPRLMQQLIEKFDMKQRQIGLLSQKMKIQTQHF
ncbi:unnamed protein product (macronuclear) [Paramecium tetraurelia]|uniref:Uncharacterized protein n=1 Tax=Paramecium tetraurelia TaxID=5888 RepID=A0C4R1_PARTE|nr:uncharacterized protein GSPATT00006277001 [Paramecium tetraurelia]CAK65778.1 unnamed protein product [Paramecium tetraurelia]|eukprot:XP_001433175.1 hypothetical protein (macronuclear) [Paramecium tetraurelia strain d4-2]